MLKKILAVTFLNAYASMWALSCANHQNVSNDMYDYVKSPEITANESGDVAIVWVAGEDGASGQEVLQVSIKSTSGLWSESESISEQEEYIYLPQIAMDNSGTMAVCWRNSGRVQHEPYFTKYLQFAQKTPHTGWSGPSNRLFGETHGLDFLKSTILFPNTLAYIWGDTVNWSHLHSWDHLCISAGYSNVKVRQILMNQSLDITKGLASNDAIEVGTEPALFMKNENEGLAVWEETGEKHKLVCAWFKNGLWSDVQEICSFDFQPFECRISDLTVFVNLRNDFVVSWAKRYRTEEKVYDQPMALTYSNQSWSLIKEIPLLSGALSSTIASMNEYSDVFIAWEFSSESSSEQQIILAYKPHDQNWLNTIDLPCMHSENCDPAIAITPSGDFILVWAGKGNTDAWGIYGATFSRKDQSWTEPTLISLSSQSASSPCIALNKLGQGWVAWEAENNKVIQVAELTLRN